MINVLASPPEGIWAIASHLASSKDPQTEDLDELLRQARDFNSEEALECLVQLTMHKDLGDAACAALKKLQDGVADGSASVSAPALRRQEKLKAVAFGAYQLATSSKAHSSFELNSLPVYVLHLAGSHARDRGRAEEVHNIQEALSARLPALGDADLLEPARAITTDELRAVVGREHGLLMKYAGVLEIHPDGVVLQSQLGAEPVIDTLFADVAEGGAKPVSLWLDNHYVHGLCTLERGQRTLILLDSAPHPDDGRADRISAALPGVAHVKLHRQPIQQDVPNACGPIGPLLFDFCGSRLFEGSKTIQDFADHFSSMRLSDKQTALDGARAHLLDACARVSSLKP